MKTLTVTDFREKCLQLLDNVAAEGVIITKRGKPVAKLVRMPASCSELIGKIKNLATNVDNDLFSTGIKWDAESRHPHTD